jgi:hypothetical protein
MSTTLGSFEGFAAEVRGLFKKACEEIIEDEIQKAQDRVRDRINKQVSRMVIDMSSQVSIIDQERQIVIMVKKQ